MPKWTVTWSRTFISDLAIEAAKQALALLRRGAAEDLVFEVRQERRSAHKVKIILPAEEPPEPSVGNDALLDDIIEAASSHGNESDPSNESEDLRLALRICWSALSPSIRRRVYAKFVHDGGSVSTWLEHAAEVPETP